jgi:hypothetical protein
MGRTDAAGREDVVMAGAQVFRHSR